MKHGGLLNKHLCTKKIQISLMTQQKLSISTFPILSLWKLSVAIATRVLIQPELNKNISFVEGNVLSKYAHFQLDPPYGFREDF